YRDNIASIKIRLSKNEGYLGGMVNDIAAGRDQIVWALDGGNTPDDLKAMISPLEALRDSLRFSANTVDQEGRYVFSGTNTSAAPMAYDASAAPGARYSYAGNTNEQRVVVGNGLTQVANDNMKGMEQLLNRLDATIATLGSATLNPNDPATRGVLEANLAGFDAALDLVSGKIAVLGGKQNILDTLDANHGNVSLSNQMAITDIGQLDMGVAATELNGYSTALQATYKAYSRIGTLSLFSAL
ncbi:MAG: flagellar hook-associated protein 3, partial [Candidatus Accumulibacter sp.]|nr:flagellar hook-associated protein 3 [Accumulibacter sp.]